MYRGYSDHFRHAHPTLPLPELEDMPVGPRPTFADLFQVYVMGEQMGLISDDERDVLRRSLRALMFLPDDASDADVVGFPVRGG